MGGVSVELRDDDGRIVNETTTDVDGMFEFETLEGIYTFLGSLEDHEEANKTTTVTAEGSTANLTYSPVPGEVIGTVSSEDDSPIENATVILEEDGANVSTDKNGSYALELDQGLHTLVATAEGFENESHTFVVRPNVSMTIDFELLTVESDNDTLPDQDMNIELDSEETDAYDTDDDGSGFDATVEDERLPADGLPFESEVVVGTFTAIGIFVGTLLVLAAVAGVRSATFYDR